ncbi:MAG: ABC transporter ATP-binding protein [Candidatus Thorarchaeota archaeon]|nr:ABC transporter ATP-binding protein [Candidatus Thorarchaeota archaeon]
MKNIISISGITKTFGEIKALDEFSLEMEPGIFGLIGPNGAGKTTLLRILLGLARQDKGTAEILENETSGDPLRYLKQIGVLHENPYFPPSMTPRQYLDDIGSLYPTSVPAEDLLSMVKLLDAADRKIGHLSAGMHRRLGIAQALVGKPKLIFLDEPTSNLDVSGRDLVVKLIVKMYQKDDVSFFITSHILSELERACHNVAFINAGKMVERGSIQELVQKHTQKRFRVITSDSWTLEEILSETEGIVDVFVDSSTSIIVEVTSDLLTGIESQLKELVKGTDVKIYGIETTGTLEDVYRKVITHA